MHVAVITGLVPAKHAGTRVRDETRIVAPFKNKPGDDAEYCRFPRPAISFLTLAPSIMAAVLRCP
jgi:hypothetical protein